MNIVTTRGSNDFLGTPTASKNTQDSLVCKLCALIIKFFSAPLTLASWLFSKEKNSPSVKPPQVEPIPSTTRTYQAIIDHPLIAASAPIALIGLCIYESKTAPLPPPETSTNLLPVALGLGAALLLTGIGIYGCKKPSKQPQPPLPLPEPPLWETLKNAWNTEDMGPLLKTSGLSEATCNRALSFIENKVPNLPYLLDRFSLEFYKTWNIDREQCTADCSAISFEFICLLKQKPEEDLTCVFREALCNHFNVTWPTLKPEFIEALYQQQLFKYRDQLIKDMSPDLQSSTIPVAQHSQFITHARTQIIYQGKMIAIALMAIDKLPWTDYLQKFLQKSDLDQFNDLSRAKKLIFNDCLTAYKRKTKQSYY